MQSSHLRLLEFAPSRTVFNQILNDASIRMGFECELVTDQSKSEHSDYGDDDNEPNIDTDGVYRDMAGDLANLVGKRVRASSAGGPNVWHIVEDGSIEDDEYIGAEIVSAVYSLREGLEKLQTVFTWMQNMNYSTNDSTGLHVSFSIEGFQSGSDYDYLKMMILFDENYTANLFDRLGEDYAKQLRDLLFAHFASTADPVAAMTSRQIADTMAILRRISKNIKFKNDNSVFGESKYYSFRHRANGVIEFRSMGGENYETKYDIIRKRIVNMAYLMKVGSDPTLMARDYISRIYKMLTTTKYQNRELGDGSQEAPAEVPVALSAFHSIFDRDPYLLSAALTNPFYFLIRLGHGLQEKRFSLGVNAIRQLRFYVAKNKVTADIARKRLQSETTMNLGQDSIYNVIANLLRWPLALPGEHDDRQEMLPFVQKGVDISGKPPEPEPETEVDRYHARQRARDQGELRVDRYQPLAHLSPDYAVRDLHRRRTARDW